jgi:hypothetical protein
LGLNLARSPGNFAWIDEGNTEMLTLIPESGGKQITTFHSVFRRLPPEVDIFPILNDLGWGRAVPITLSDGTRARLQFTAALRDPDLVGELQPPEHHVPRHRYQAQCTALLGLAVTVLCTASDEEQARRIITEVFRGERSRPEGFRIVLDADDAEALIERLKAAIDGRMPLDNAQVLVTELAPIFDRVQHQLEYRP